MHALLSLANTESHNFTAEVLLRQAADQWDVRAASAAAHRWMQQQGIPVKGLRVADGSGLSRNNRVSSQTIAALLMRMDQHPYASYYQASMAIAGQRGTLRNYFIGSPIRRQVLGKDRNDQRGALNFWNSPNQGRSALLEHDFKWCQPTERNDRPDPESGL
jgi:D-alanyl-D-alanine carboxypeptidase/D-alanyl-D-alanine-endopeptidase (penicillin-binding protein 4)